MKKVLVIAPPERRRDVLQRLGDLHVVEARSPLEGLWHFGHEVEEVLVDHGDQLEHVRLRT